MPPIPIGSRVIHKQGPIFGVGTVVDKKIYKNGGEMVMVDFKDYPNYFGIPLPFSENLLEILENAPTNIQNNNVENIRNNNQEGGRRRHRKGTRRGRKTSRRGRTQHRK